MDGVYVDWAGAVKMQEQVSCCTRSFNFSEYMSAMGFPVCTQIFAYLQSTDAYGGALVVCGYAFKSGELKAVLAFFDAHDQRAQARTPFISIYQSIRSLVVQRCELSDRDCHTLCSRISHMTGLVSLNLRENRLTYSGAASLASALYEHSTRMRILRLDGNNIKADGAPRCCTKCPSWRCCLSPKTQSATRAFSIFSSTRSTRTAQPTHGCTSPLEAWVTRTR